MSLHEVEFEYYIREGSSIEMDLDPALDESEKESIALREIIEAWDDVCDITIKKMKEID